MAKPIPNDMADVRNWPAPAFAVDLPDEFRAGTLSKDEAAKLGHDNAQFVIWVPVGRGRLKHLAFPFDGKGAPEPETVATAVRSLQRAVSAR